MRERTASSSLTVSTKGFMRINYIQWTRSPSIQEDGFSSRTRTGVEEREWNINDPLIKIICY